MLLLGPFDMRTRFLMHGIILYGTYMFLRCSEMTLWPPLGHERLVPPPQNLRLTNFCSISCMIFSALYYIYSCILFHVSYVGWSFIKWILSYWLGRCFQGWCICLGDEWDGFYFWEGGSLRDLVVYNGIPLTWILKVTCAYGWPP
jgi:hypothetical protein